LLITQSADIQKVFAFEGAFDRLFTIITEEHGLDGGAIVLEALGCVDALLRFNSSNQVLVLTLP
jgi:intracellular protein transport protein USO1